MVLQSGQELALVPELGRGGRDGTVEIKLLRTPTQYPFVLEQREAFELARHLTDLFMRIGRRE